MTQIVSKVNDLVSDGARGESVHDTRSGTSTTGTRSKDANGFTVSKPIHYAVVAIAVIMVFGGLIMGARAFYQAPPTSVAVSAQGLSTLQYQSLTQAMQQQPTDNFFQADLQAIRDRALSLPWVDQVSVMRDWQQGIVVDVLPKQGVANFGSERLVDAQGDVFVPADSNDVGKANFVNLQGEPTQAPVIMQQMQQVNDWFAPLDLQVADMILTPRQTWLIQFDNGLRVIVDNENTAQKLMTLSHMLSSQLHDEQDKIQSVDLRYKNGFTIAWKPEATQQTGSNADAQVPENSQANQG